MVVHFEYFPFHIQKNIAEKTDFMDFIRLRISSKIGRDFGMVKCAMKIPSIDVTPEDILCTIDYEKQFFWKIVKNYESCPRFYTESIGFRHALKEDQLEELINSAEEGKLLFKNVHLHMIRCTIESRSDFYRILQCKRFDITKLYCDGRQNFNYLTHPVVQKMERLKIVSGIINESLLLLKAVDISLHGYFRNRNNTLNLFFKQWFHGMREISEFSYGDLERRPFEEKDLKEILADLPCSLLWSLETHERSFMSRLSLDYVQHYAKYDTKFYTLSNTKSTLFMQFHKDGGITAKEMSSDSDCRSIIEKEMLLRAKLSEQNKQHKCFINF